MLAKSGEEGKYLSLKDESNAATVTQIVYDLIELQRQLNSEKRNDNKPTCSKEEFLAKANTIAQEIAFDLIEFQIKLTGNGAKSYSTVSNLKRMDDQCGGAKSLNQTAVAETKQGGKNISMVERGIHFQTCFL